MTVLIRGGHLLVPVHEEIEDGDITLTIEDARKVDIGDPDYDQVLLWWQEDGRVIV